MIGENFDVRLKERARGWEYTSLSERTSRLLTVGILGAVLFAVGFAGGWSGARHVKIDGALMHASLVANGPGDASSAVRAEVQKVLQQFQDGYTRRDPAELGKFMEEVFPRDKNILLLGTDSEEWVSGDDAIRDFIHEDWTKWGDVRLDVQHPVISASGDAAWLATRGVVIHSVRRSRPLRFTAVLSREAGKWTFRQVQFEWDEQQASLGEMAKMMNFGKLRWQ